MRKSQLKCKLDKEQRQQENVLTIAKGSHLETLIYNDNVENINIMNNQ